MRQALYIIICVLSLLVSLTACDRDAHEGDNGLTVALDNSRCADAPIGEITVCLFGTDGHRAAVFRYPDARALASSLMPVEAGHYTVVAVVNTGIDEAECRTLTALHDKVASAAADNPDVLSGMTDCDVSACGISRVVVPLCRGAFPLPVLRIMLTLPEPHLPDYTPATVKSRAAGAGYVLRCVAELYRAGTEEQVVRKPLNPELQADGTYLVELEAGSGEYDLRLWTDYARADAPCGNTYYNTEDLRAVGIVTEPYTANTDAKDAAYRREDNIFLPEDGTEIRVQMQRPLAKYRIIADDVAGYRKLTEVDAVKYPPLETLTVAIRYEGFFPCTFNILNDNPIDALTGLGFRQPLPAVGGDDTELQLASDWVMVNGRESSVGVTVVVTDAAGRTVCSTSGVQIPYRRSCLTTIRGDFLTAGVSGGGIHINTEWEGTFEVRF